MDEITEQIEKLKLDKAITVRFIDKNELFNKQKCFIARNIFDELAFKAGKMALVNCYRSNYLCKVYPKPSIDWGIEVDTSVNVGVFSSILEHADEKIKMSDICKISDTVSLNEVHLKIIFDSINCIHMWNKRDELIKILKRNILKNFVFLNQSSINLKNLEYQQRMGINRIEIVTTLPLSTNAICKVIAKTKIIIVDMITQFQFNQMNINSSPLFSLEIPLQRLIEIVNLNEIYNKKISTPSFPPPKQILLVGPSGCGKSSLVKAVAHKTNCTIVSIIGHEVNKSDPGETESALRNLFLQAFQYAELSGKCIINLEEVDNLCPRKIGSASHVQRATSQLLLLLDKAQTSPGIIVIGTTNKPEILDLSIRRHGRLETEIYIGPPSEFERETILKHLIENLCIHQDIQTILCSEIAHMTPGYVGADLQLLCNSIAWKIYKEMLSGKELSLEFWMKEFRNGILNMTPASLKGTLGVITAQNTSFNELSGLDNIKKLLEMAVIWPIKHHASFTRMGIPRPKGVLLYGPPGCAKTSLVRALASLGTFSLLSISAAELYSPFVGDAERLICQLFQRARQNSPCILFIDEIDALAGTRGESNQVNSEVQDRIIASLLTQMDGVGHKMIAADTNHEPIDFRNSDEGVIVIGATNRPDMVDAALLRPGRFDKHIHVPSPDILARLEILKTYMSKMPLADDIDLTYLASKTELYSGADLKNICSEAAMIAMTEEGMNISFISNKHFVKALCITKPSLNSSQLNQYVNFKTNKLIS